MMDSRRREARFTNKRNNYPRSIDSRGNSYGHDDRGLPRQNVIKRDGRNSKQDVRNRYTKNLSVKDRYKLDRRNRRDEEMSDPESCWFKVIIPRGTKCTKDHIISSLQQNMNTQLFPLNFHAEGNATVFYVQGSDQMSAIKACSRRIYDNNGYALNINVQPSQMPIPPMNKMVEDNISEALKRRYNPALRSLFLYSFAQEPGLMEVDLYIPLSRMPIFNLVVEKIRKEYPDIIGLSVADNKLATLQPLSHLQPICKNLKALDISKNKIKTIAELDHIKGLELEELAIEGNPFASASSFSEADKSSLISSLRTRFPKLAKLDGVNLPPAIGFDLGESGEVPPSYGHHIPSELKGFVGEFLEQYFKIYDSDDRRPMLAAYHDQAVFSYSVGKTDNKQNIFMQSMILGSRNLLRIRDDGDVKSKLLHRGGPAIVDALMSMPRTKHAPALMTIDVPFYFNQSFFVVVVNGVLKEFTKKQVHTRAFCRTFLIVPQGTGFVIINDILIIMNATVDQVQKFGRSLDQDSIINCIKADRFSADCLGSLSLGGEMDPVSQGGGQLQSPVQLQPQLDSMNKDSLIQQFCSMTNMNRQFATQCLEENAYDLQKSFDVFTQLNKQGAIPAQAFVH